jgi:hypothetical protein
MDDIGSSLEPEYDDELRAQGADSCGRVGTDDVPGESVFVGLGRDSAILP